MYTIYIPKNTPGSTCWCLQTATQCDCAKMSMMMLLWQFKLWGQKNSGPVPTYQPTPVWPTIGWQPAYSDASQTLSCPLWCIIVTLILNNAKNHYFREVKQSVCSLRILRSGSCFKKCNLTRCIFEWCASTIKFVLQPLTIKINMKCKLISTFFVQIEWDFIITISTVTTTIISTMTTIIIPSSSMITSMICFTIVMLISKPEVVECKDKRYEIREQTRSVY